MFAELLPLTPLETLICVVIIFISYVVKGLSGFGSGLIAVPLLAFFLPITFIVPLLGLLSYSGTIAQSVQLKRQVVWHEIWPLLPFSLAGISLAVWLLVNLDPQWLVRGLALFVVSYSVYALLPVPALHGSRWWAIPAGSLGGIVGALFGTGGPFYVIYLKLRGLDKSQFRASIVLIFLLDGGVRIIGYALNGLYTVNVILMLLILLPVLILAMLVGNHLHIKLNQLVFNRLISGLLFISGVMLLYKSFSG